MITWLLLKTARHPMKRPVWALIQTLTNWIFGPIAHLGMVLCLATATGTGSVAAAKNCTYWAFPSVPELLERVVTPRLIERDNLHVMYRARELHLVLYDLICRRRCGNLSAPPQRRRCSRPSSLLEVLLLRSRPSRDAMLRIWDDRHSFPPVFV